MRRFLFFFFSLLLLATNALAQKSYANNPSDAPFCNSENANFTITGPPPGNSVDIKTSTDYVNITLKAPALRPSAENEYEIQLIYPNKNADGGQHSNFFYVTIDANQNGVIKTTDGKPASPFYSEGALQSGVYKLLLGHINQSNKLVDNWVCYATFNVTDDTSNGGGGGPGTLCKVDMNFPQDPKDSSKTKGFSPLNTISFSISALDSSIDKADRRGITVYNRSTQTDVLNTCATDDDLNHDKNPGGFSIGSYNAGIYDLRITEHCFDLFSTADGKLMCTKEVDVCSSGDCTSPGDECNPKNNTCGKSAPFCINNPNLVATATNPHPPAHICSQAPTARQLCKNGMCKTAIGDFGYKPSAFAASVLQLFLSLGGLILLGTIIISGYRFMVSSGDPEKVKEAREGIVSAVSGLFLIIFALVILQLITHDILRLPGFN